MFTLFVSLLCAPISSKLLTKFMQYVLIQSAKFLIGLYVTYYSLNSYANVFFFLCTTWQVLSELEAVIEG